MSLISIQLDLFSNINYNSYLSILFCFSISFNLCVNMLQYTPTYFSLCLSYVSIYLNV